MPSVVLDANVVVTALISPGSICEQVVQAAATIGIVLSADVLDEWSSVLARPRIGGRIGQAPIDNLLNKIATVARHVTIAACITDCRDPKDSKYLELALAAGDATIVSGDRDLLDLDPWRGIRIVTPAQFLALAANQAARP